MRGAADIDVVLKVTRIGLDQILDVVVEPGDAAADAEQGLVHARIIARAGLGLEVGIGEEKEGGKLSNNCSSDGALKPLPIAGVEFGARGGDEATGATCQVTWLPKRLLSS